MSTVPFTMPFTEHLGIAIESADENGVVGTMEVTDNLCTTGKRLHGGAIMAFADSLGAIGAYLALPEGAKTTTTIESKTNFVGAAPRGSKVRGTTTAIHAGRRTSVWQTKITDENGKLVANVTQTQLVL